MPRRNYNPRKGRRRAYSGSGQSGLLAQLQNELGAARPPSWQERREEERRNRPRNAPQEGTTP